MGDGPILGYSYSGHVTQKKSGVRKCSGFQRKRRLEPYSPHKEPYIKVHSQTGCAALVLSIRSTVAAMLATRTKRRRRTRRRMRKKKRNKRRKPTSYLFAFHVILTVAHSQLLILRERSAQNCSSCFQNGTVQICFQVLKQILILFSQRQGQGGANVWFFLHLSLVSLFFCASSLHGT